MALLCRYEQQLPSGFGRRTVLFDKGRGAHDQAQISDPSRGAHARRGGDWAAEEIAFPDGYRSGHFPEGSVTMFDNHETLAAQGAEFPGRRRFIDVMVKTDGSWRFGEFAGTAGGSGA
jgi:hypothetical protein